MNFKVLLSFVLFYFTFFVVFVLLYLVLFCFNPIHLFNGILAETGLRLRKVMHCHSTRAKFMKLTSIRDLWV